MIKSFLDLDAYKDSFQLSLEAVGEANEMINHLALAKAKGCLKPEKADELIERYHVIGKKLTRLKENWKNY